MTNARPRARQRRRASLQRERQVIPPGYFTTDDIRLKLGLTEAELQRLRREKTLTVDAQTGNGWSLYSEAQVKMLEAKKIDGTLFHIEGRAPLPYERGRIDVPAEDSARVFEMLDKGMLPHRIVIDTRLAPHVIDQIRSDYDRLSGSMTIPRPLLDQMNGLKRLNGRFPLRCASDLLEVLQIADAVRICTTCRKVPATSECSGCVYERAAVDVKAKIATEIKHAADAAKRESDRVTAAVNEAVDGVPHGGSRRAHARPVPPPPRSDVDVIDGEDEDDQPAAVASSSSQ